MSSKTVTTSIDIQAPPEKVWHVLGDAQLPLTAPCWFRLSVPTPQRCQLVAERGGVGARRQCITSRGQIDQRITEWAENERLTFEVVSDTVGLSACLDHMHDTFTLERLPDGRTRLTRWTQFQTRGWLNGVKAVALCLVVKRIHRYVMENFKAIAEGGQTADG